MSYIRIRNIPIQIANADYVKTDESLYEWALILNTHFKQEEEGKGRERKVITSNR